MNNRNDFRKRLIKIFATDNLYFDPKEKVMFKYPAVIYRKLTPIILYAGNKPFYSRERYLVTYMTTDQDSKIPLLAAMEYGVSYDDSFCNNGLCQHIFTIQN